MIMSNQLGDEFKLYIDTADDYDTPTWAEILDVGNFSRDRSKTEVEIPKRINHKVYLGGRSDPRVSFELSYDPANTNHTKLSNAIDSGAKVHLAVANGPIATDGTIYTHGWYLVKGPEDFSLDSPATISCEALPHAAAPDDEPPAKVTVST